MHNFVLPVRLRERRDRTYRFLAASSGVARDGGIVESTAWDVRSFVASGGPFLWSHERKSLPIGRVLELRTTERGLEAEVEFAGEEEQHPFAETVRRLYDGGFLHAVSVGFDVKERRNPTERERALGARWVATRVELYEISAVAVPADPDAVLQRDITGALETLSGLLTTEDEPMLEREEKPEEPSADEPKDEKEEKPDVMAKLEALAARILAAVERLEARAQDEPEDEEGEDEEPVGERQPHSQEATVTGAEREAPGAPPADESLYEELLQLSTRYAGPKAGGDK